MLFRDAWQRCAICFNLIFGALWFYLLHQFNAKRANMRKVPLAVNQCHSIDLDSGQFIYQQNAVHPSWEHSVKMSLIVSWTMIASIHFQKATFAVIRLLWSLYIQLSLSFWQILLLWRKESQSQQCQRSRNIGIGE